VDWLLKDAFGSLTTIFFSAFPLLSDFSNRWPDAKASVESRGVLARSADFVDPHFKEAEFSKQRVNSIFV
jgi:hypothetical protein